MIVGKPEIGIGKLRRGIKQIRSHYLPLFDRLIPFFLFGIGISQIVARRTVIVFDRQRFFEVVNGLFRLPLIVVGQPQVVLHIVVIGSHGLGL